MLKVEERGDGLSLVSGGGVVETAVGWIAFGCWRNDVVVVADRTRDHCSLHRRTL